jgi:uncharacterized protein (DUF1800 family)
MVSSLDKVDPNWAWEAYMPTPTHPWDRRMAAHLFRRAGFAANSKQLDEAVKQSPNSVVEHLVQGPASGSGKGTSDDLARTILATGDPQQLAAWWTYVLIHSDHPTLERMTLLWHGHFATGAEKVRDAALMLEQNRLLRRFALGDWRALVHEISRDPAMLIYLDSATNRKAHPNENFAREVMELFCLGEGNYSEKDVQELARCFTGWEIKLGQFRFNRFQHDSGSKTILGKTAPFPEGESVDWILQQPHAARFVAGKLFKQFICDEPAPSESLLEPLAKDLRDQWQVGPVLQRILASQIFYSEHAIARKVRSPVDLAIGLLRALEGSTNTQQLANELQQNGQGLFFPPNVKGWDGGRTWINSSTILGRANMIRRLLEDEKTRFAGGKLDEYFVKLGSNQPGEIVDRVADLLLAVPLATPTRDGLVDLFRRSRNPIVETIHALATLPEFQLA